MNIIRAVVVDDEKPGRERLRRLLSRDARVELAGCCASGAEALTLIREAAGAGRPVHVMFLDVQMPAFDGFAVISSLVADLKSVAVPSVVFVTAHDEYARPVSRAARDAGAQLRRECAASRTSAGSYGFIARRLSTSTSSTGCDRMRTATTSCCCATAPRFASADGFAGGCRRGSARLCSPASGSERSLDAPTFPAECCGKIWPALCGT